MATAGSIDTKDLEPAARKFVEQASAEQLQRIMAGTVLARHPSVSSQQGTPEEKTESLRKLIAHEMKRHADFRGMVIRMLAREKLVSAPAKEAKKEAPAAAGKEGAEGQERKPKKEKEKRGEKPEGGKHEGGGKPAGGGKPEAAEKPSS
jgi:hypothetical protein